MGSVSPPIGETLATDALKDGLGAHRVIDAKGLALVIAEVKFGKVALQVLLRDVVKRADDAALENEEIAFDATADLRADTPHTPIKYSTTSFASKTSDTIIVASASTNQTPNTLFFSTNGQRRM